MKLDELKHNDAARHVGLTPQTLKRYRLKGIGPRYIRRGPRQITYCISDLDEWMQSRTFQGSDGNRRAEPHTENLDVPEGISITDPDDIENLRIVDFFIKAGEVEAERTWKAIALLSGDEALFEVEIRRRLFRFTCIKFAGQEWPGRREDFGEFVASIAEYARARVLTEFRAAAEGGRA